jgi:drug/metabolite transporter (DMT)-like permease
MSMLGLRTLPVNHRLHPVYRVLGAVVGLLLIVFAVVGFVVSGDVLGAPASTGFCAVCLVAGAVLVLAAVQGGNLGAEVNAYVGALLILLGFACLLTMHIGGANFLDASMADVIILFVAGVVGLAAGFYGRVGEQVHQPAARDSDPSARA